MKHEFEKLGSIVCDFFKKQKEITKDFFLSKEVKAGFMIILALGVFLPLMFLSIGSILIGVDVGLKIATGAAKGVYVAALCMIHAAFFVQLACSNIFGETVFRRSKK